jgi:uncharacterized protein (TIGR03086 family)
MRERHDRRNGKSRMNASPSQASNEVGESQAIRRHADPADGSVPAHDRPVDNTAAHHRARPSLLALALLARASDGFTQRLGLVRPHQWPAPTPCAAWDVQALVNHVVGANRRYTMLLHGATADEVDATRTADHLGADPVASLVATANELTAAIREPGAMARTAHHPVGERTGAQLLEMRVLDVTVHTWDLARAIGADESLDPDLVAFALTLRDTFEAGREHGSFAPPPGETPAGWSAQARLLHLSGRSTSWRRPTPEKPLQRDPRWNAPVPHPTPPTAAAGRHHYCSLPSPQQPSP